jgi:hypothetical protein
MILLRRISTTVVADEVGSLHICLGVCPRTLAELSEVNGRALIPERLKGVLRYVPDPHEIPFEESLSWRAMSAKRGYWKVDRFNRKRRKDVDLNEFDSGADAQRVDKKD